MLEELKAILRVIREYKCERSYYYHLLKRFEENENYVKEGSVDIVSIIA